MKEKFSKEIDQFIENSKLEEISIGCSDSQVFKISKNENIYFLKKAKNGLLTREHNALEWLQGKLPVPKIVIYETTKEEEFLITEGIQGEMVCSDTYLKNPDLVLKIIASAFKEIYQINIEDCPFDVSLNYKLNLVEKNVNEGLVTDESLKPEILKKFGSAKKLLDYLKENKFQEELCFSHGDMSLPNIFANGDTFAGFIDVGECGIADKWFDLAICEKSIKRNYGEEYIPKFYLELGIEPDRSKINYYLLLMELYL